MMHLLRSVISGLRNQVAEAIVQSVDDTGAAQTANVTTGTGVDRAAVEVSQPFGFGSVPPTDGPIGILVAVGGDPSNLRLLPLADPSTRFTGLLPGEAVMYGADGSRVRIRQGGAVEIWGGASVTIYSKTTVIDAPNGCTINGNVIVNGSFTATGDVSDSHGSLNRLRGNYDAHTHPAGGTTSNPDPE